jgi:acetylornithine/N-succinyldiaminopimelate aminotransferase
VIPALMPLHVRPDLVFERGEGCYLFDTGNKRYLDFISGIGVTGLGHSHPHLVAALNAQGAKVWHNSNLFRIADQERLAERLIGATFADSVFFFNSGSEAIECSIKMARKAHDAAGNPERYRIITFEGAFHGRTMAAISAGQQPKHTEGFEPLLQGFDQAPFCDLDAVRALVGPETAGILIEPVQGEGGIRPVADEVLAGLREIADEHGLLLMFDEVQCGMGRTGKLLANEWSGVEPDIAAVAKALGGGFPVGACLAKEAPASAMTVGSHGTTFGGNPLAMAVANAVLDVFLADGFFAHVCEMAEMFTARLDAFVAGNSSLFESVRGKGLMLGMKCREGVANTDLMVALRERGLLAGPAGDNVLRFLPPLIIEPAHIDEALDILDATCAEFRG